MSELQDKEAYYKTSYLQKGQILKLLKFSMWPSFWICYIHHYTQEALDGWEARQHSNTLHLVMLISLTQANSNCFCARF